MISSGRHNLDMYNTDRTIPRAPLVKSFARAGLSNLYKGSALYIRGRPALRGLSPVVWAIAPQMWKGPPIGPDLGVLRTPLSAHCAGRSPAPPPPFGDLMTWMIRPDAFVAFENEEIRNSLSRYIRVVRGEEAPLFRIAQRIRVDISGGLWKAHEEGLNVMKEFLSGECDLEDQGQISLLDVKIRLAKELARNCRLCEWKCGVNRLEGEIGVCRVRGPRISSAFIHMGEEPPITPSGTIFFSGCNFKCVFCQNWDISQYPESGKPVSERDLSIMMDRLRRSGARNINLVGGEPTPNLPSILAALPLTSEDFPIIWNSNMYMSEEATKLLIGIVDLWLPDFKYWDDECARKYSKVVRYRETVTRNLKIAYELGDMIIRHLVLPNHLECCTKPILKWISDNTPNALVNIMAQYRPEYMAKNYPEIDKRVRRDEMVEAYRYADDLGLKWRSVS